MSFCVFVYVVMAQLDFFTQAGVVEVQIYLCGGY